MQTTTMKTTKATIRPMVRVRSDAEVVADGETWFVSVPYKTIEVRLSKAKGIENL